jgi:hypothetical protein
MAAPGELSKSHAFLGNNCIACHTPNKGVEAQNCIVCHANNQSLLQRQPTAFHADIRSCSECHVEHQGTELLPTQMDHSALVKIGNSILAKEKAADARDGIMSRIRADSGSAAVPAGKATTIPPEAALSCITCHSNQDRHRELFGANCIQCHSTTAWTIPEFRHPAPSSTSCAQCHQAPPSHYMMHFQMVSMKVAKQENARVDQCFLCHQTTAWNDIKEVGWYKHH